MVKTRFSSLDVRAMVNSIRPWAVGCKLTNIYDINSKVYLLKLQRKGFKCFLLLESGVRFHLTEYNRDKSSIPSNYTMKLRKHLRTKRLTSISQLGADRIVDFTFGYGENAFHLLLEIYVSGNLIMTDHEYKILTLLRVAGADDAKIAMREVYPVSKAIGLLKVPLDEFQPAIEEILDLASVRAENQEIQEIDEDDDHAKKAIKKGAESAFAKRSKKRVQHAALPVVTLLHKLAPFSDPVLCSACIARACEAMDRPCPNAFKLTVDDFTLEEVVELVQNSARFLLETLQSVSRPDDLGGGSMPVMMPSVEAGDGNEPDEGEDEDDDDEAPPASVAADTASVADSGGAGAAGGAAASGSRPPAGFGGPCAEAEAPVVPGWIIRKKVHTPPADPTWANDEFSPLQPLVSLEPEAFLSYPSFHRCVDEFFVQVEEYKAVEQKAQHAQSVMARVERIRQDQGRRVEVLEAEQEASERKARLIEENVELVDRALLMLNAMIASQIDWAELWKEVKRQQRLGHPIAQHIHSLNLEQNEFKLLLAEKDEDEDGDGAGGIADTTMEVVPLDLNLSSHANVARLHTRRKETREKTSRTLTHADAAIKLAERKANQELQKYSLKQTIRKVRHTWWFEKFIWFISSENYLVVTGHDTIQTEQIFLKYIGKEDAFVQADVAGARSCFVRNPDGGEVPPATLREAGTLALCHSTAWDKQIVISAWYVPVSQVTRGREPEDNNYHGVDGFFVRGRRHFMPPLHLEMGVTLLFQVSDASADARHKGERRSRYLEAMAGNGDAGAAEVEAERPEEECQELAAEESEAEDKAEGEKDECEDEVAGKSCTDGSKQASAAVQEEEEEEEEDEDLGAAEDEASGGRPSGAAPARIRVGAAERRRQKKGGGAGDADGGGEPSGDEDHFDPPPRGQPQKAGDASKPISSNSSKGPAPLPRGQRAKVKKMKDKYGEQDEEERELRLALLGSKATKRAGGGESGGGGDGIGRRASDGEGSEATPVPEAAEGTPAESGRTPASASRPGGNGSAAGGGGGSEPSERRPPPPRRQPPAGGSGAALEVLTAGCEADGGSADSLPIGRLDLLTGQPQTEDEVLFALAMVAPFCSLSGPYALRIKLSPGNQKKGQAVRQCMKIFQEQLQRREWKQLVQAIPENEAMDKMCGSCKLSMPGLQKLQQVLRKEKKKEGKDLDKQHGAPKSEPKKPEKKAQKK